MAFRRYCFAQAFSALVLFETLPERAPTITQLRVLSIMQLRAWAHQQFSYTQFYLLSTLYVIHNVTHIMNYFRPSTAFPTASDRKLGGAWERGYFFCVHGVLLLSVYSLCL